MHLCWLVVFFFPFLVFFFLLLFFLTKKVVPTSDEVYFFSSVGLTLNRGGSGYTISQTIRGDYTPLHTHALASHTRNTRHMFQAHTHTHTRETWRSLSHTFELRKAATTKGERDELFVDFVSLHKHPDSEDVTHTHTHTPSDSKIHKPLTRMRHWSRTMLHYTWHSEDVGGAKCKYCTLWDI